MDRQRLAAAALLLLLVAVGGVAWLAGGPDAAEGPTLPTPALDGLVLQGSAAEDDLPWQWWPATAIVAPKRRTSG